jgi:site-specific DNA-methyltransferase (adenine-specific)
MSLPKPYYDKDGITIYHADCREILPFVGRFDLCLTDPPYGLAGSETDKNDYLSYDDSRDSTTSLVREVLAMCRSITDRVIMTPGQSLMFSYPEPDAIGAFYYPAGTGSCSWGFVGWQPIFYYGKDPFLARGLGRLANSFVSTESAEKSLHPCPKPIKTWERLMQRVSFDGETILDPFMGSGTTLVAAKQLGRKCVGIELEEKYCEIAVQRLAQDILPFGEVA